MLLTSFSSARDENGAMSAECRERMRANTLDLVMVTREVPGHGAVEQKAEDWLPQT
jgi:hypothetical protein